MTLLDIFDRIYVINLPQRTDRRAQISSELAQHSLSWNEERLICWSAQRPQEADGFPSIGAHGCFLSHLAALQDAAALQDGYVLVLEDDAMLLPAVKRHLLQLAVLMQACSPDFLFLGHIQIDGPAPGQDGFLSSNTAVEGAHAYAVRALLLPLLLPYLQACLQHPPGHPRGGRMHFDAALSQFRRFHPGCRSWLAQPGLVLQRYSRSDIQPHWWYDRWPLLRNLTSLARKLRQSCRSIRQSGV